MPQVEDCNDGLVSEPTSDAGWQVRLLGGVRLTAPDGADVDPGPAKCQELLGALALSIDRSVSVDGLVDMLWGEEPPRTAPKTLQTYVARLRKTIGRDTIVRVGGAYRLDLPDESIDVRRFRSSLAVGDPDGAIAEWGGVPLAGLDASGLRPMIDGLVEEWLGAVEIVLEREVETDPQGAIGRLTEMTALHPFREGLWALLMQALYAAGRQADALSAYGRARHHLIEELGVEPGPRLRELESRILAQDDELPARPSGGAQGASLPTGTVTFAYAEVEDIAGLWLDHRDDAGAALSRHDQILRSLTDEYGGHEVVSGESFGTAFHRARDGLDWATAVQQAMAEEPNDSPDTTSWPPYSSVRERKIWS